MNLDAPFNITDFGFSLDKVGGDYLMSTDETVYVAYLYNELGELMYVVEIQPKWDENSNFVEMLSFDVPETNRQFIDFALADLPSLKLRSAADELVGILTAIYRNYIIDEMLPTL